MTQSRHHMSWVNREKDILAMTTYFADEHLLKEKPVGFKPHSIIMSFLPGSMTSAICVEKHRNQWRI